MRHTAVLLTGILSIMTAPTTASALPQATSGPGPHITQAPATETLSQQLMKAVRAGDVEKTRTLLASGANPDGDPLARHPVLDAASSGNTAIVRLLAEAGASLDATLWSTINLDRPVTSSTNSRVGFALQSFGSRNHPGGIFGAIDSSDS
jgi:hypothetical protein